MFHLGSRRATHALLGCLVASALFAQAPARKERNKPRIQFVTVDEGVRLEVLDWGGTGSPLVLLAGSGNTAHVFDGFADRLIPLAHVYAITSVRLELE